MSAGENQIVVYQPNETVRLDVRLENETVWLTQAKRWRGVKTLLAGLRWQSVSPETDVMEAA